ncbi:MAG: deoxyuridine 5'-triphosphate nucleotidohydrolase [Nitrospinota bacterium]
MEGAFRHLAALAGEDLHEALRADPPLVEGLLDPEVQVQPNGIELTLKSVAALMGPGSLGFDNRDRSLAKGRSVAFDADGWTDLKPGAYRIEFTELVHIPPDVFAIARARSSLHRCGVTVETALWDAGFQGASEALLVVHNRHGFRLRRGARLIQLIFFKMLEAVDEPYAGRYRSATQAELFQGGTP